MNKFIKKIYSNLINMIKNNKWSFITLLFSSITLIVIYIFNKIAPFGNNSMLDIDFYHQYGPLLNELVDRIRSGESLLYSFNTGAGIPFFKNYFNYLSSPFNIVLLLFKKRDIVMAYSIVIGLKAIISSFTMSFYLRKNFKKESFLVTVFSILYTYSGYFCAYYWNIMWLDGIVMLPLIMLGINRLIDNEKPLLYIVTLAIMLYSNYFIGYMICIYSVLYFVFYYILKRKFKIKDAFRKISLFTISSLLAGGLVAFALLPLYKSLSSISATSGTFPDLELNFSFIDYLFNHISGVKKTVFASDALPLPNVYSGIIVLVLSIVLFLNKKIDLKHKLVFVIMFLFFYACFNVNVIDYVWHAFHVPNDLPWRYSFIYVFSLIIFAYYSAINIKNAKIIYVSIASAVVLIFVFLSYKVGFENIDYEKLISCMVILALYYITYILFFSKKISKKFVKLTFILIACGECVIGINANWTIDHDISTFMTNKNGVTDSIKYIKALDGGLYRIERTDTLTLNDGAWFDYYGISTFSSMAYENVSKFQRMIGLSGNDINSYYYKYAATPIYNLMFNIRYNIGEFIDNDYYEYLDNIKDNNINKFKYQTSIGYAVNKDLKNYSLSSYEPFYNQSNFVKFSTDIENIYKDIKINSIENATIYDINDSILNGEHYYELLDDNMSLIVNLNNEKEQNIYLYIGGNNVDCFYVDDIYYSLTSDEYYIVDIGKKKIGNIKIEIKFNDSEPDNLMFYAYSLNDEKFNNFYEEIKDEIINVKEYSDTNIKGSINVKEDKMVYTTLAYDEGWKVYVDGKETNTYIVADSYMGFDIKEGNHNIEFRYFPKLMKEGIIISIISLLTIVAMSIKVKKSKINFTSDKHAVNMH